MKLRIFNNLTTYLPDRIFIQLVSNNLTYIHFDKISKDWNIYHFLISLVNEPHLMECCIRFTLKS